MSATGFVGAAVAFSSKPSWAAPAGAAPDAQMTRPLVVYFGTGPMGEGIYTFELDPASGMLT